MNYEVVFDVAQSGYRDWRFAAAGLPFLAIGVTWLVWRRRHPDPKLTGWRRLHPWFMTGFALVWSTVAFAGTYSAYRSLRGALERGECATVEGVVEHFVPGDAGGHPDESFDVGGRRFEYSDFMITGGFNNMRSHGGPMQEGLHVRIASVGGVIARIEVAR
jgi:hypothetical protein